jgi:hypothetical protein
MQPLQPNAIGSVVPIFGGVGGGGGGGGGTGIISLVGAWTVPVGSLVGQLIYVTGAFVGDLADASAPATTPVVGMIIVKPTPTTATVLYLGESPVGLLAGLAIGSEYFLSLVAGGIIIEGSAPIGVGEVVQRVGVAITATQLLFNPDPTKVIL